MSISAHLAVLAAAAVATSAFAQSPIAWWKFDEGAGLIASDSGPIGADGLLSGNAAFTAGVSGNAVSIPGGPGSLVRMSNVLSMVGTDFSMQTWVRTTVAANSSTVIAGKHNTGYLNGYLMRLNFDGSYGATNRAQFYQSNPANSAAIGTSSITDGTWHHLLATYTVGGQLRLYVDGNLEASTPAQPIIDNDAPFMVGGANTAGNATNYFSGDVDEVQIYNYALNADQVAFLASHPGAAIPAPASGAAMIGLAAFGVRRRR